MPNLEGNCFLTVVYLLAKMTLYSPSGAVLTIKVVVLLRDNMSKEDTSESQRMLRTLYTCWNKEPGCKDSEPRKEHCPSCSYMYHFSILFENILASRICRIPTCCMIWRRKNDRIISFGFEVFLILQERMAQKPPEIIAAIVSRQVSNGLTGPWIFCFSLLKFENVVLCFFVSLNFCWQTDRQRVQALKCKVCAKGWT